MRYAVLETNSGYVWAVVDAQSPLDACYEADNRAGGSPEDFNGVGKYVEVSVSDINTTKGHYDVREAPSGFDVQDGQDREQIAAVEALPRAGVFTWQAED